MCPDSVRKNGAINAVAGKNLAQRLRKKVHDDFSYSPAHYTNHIQNLINSLVAKSKATYPVFEQKLRSVEDFAQYKDNSMWIIDETINDLVSFNTAYYSYEGYCDICGKEVKFYLDSKWVTHTEGLHCTNCWHSSRHRNLFRFFLRYYKNGMSVYINEEITPFYKILKKLVPHLTGSEYQHSTDCRYEDSCNLSFKDKSFDIYLSNDVFEHVFDYERAFCEAARILKKNGLFIFHVPFSLRKETIIRATQANGVVTHLEPPIYHGNPINPQEGSLWVNDFGFDMLETLKKCGFSDAYAILSRDLYRGILNRSALVFIAEAG